MNHTIVDKKNNINIRLKMKMKDFWRNGLFRLKIFMDCIIYVQHNFPILFVNSFLGVPPLIIIDWNYIHYKCDK